MELVIDVFGAKGKRGIIGKELGTFLADKQKVINGKELTGDLNQAQSLLKSYAPGLMEELAGIAQSTGLDHDYITLLCGGAGVKMPQMGCSAIGRKDWYLRNYDWSPELFDGLLVAAAPDKGYASIGVSAQAAGRLDGMNEKGLTAGLHFVNHGKEEETGFLAITAVRLVLDNCATVAEAEALLAELPHRDCYNFSLMDAEGNMSVVEASPAKVVVKPTDQLSCANHYTSDTMRPLNKPTISKSKRRLGAMHQMPADKRNAFQAFNQVDSPIFATDYEHFFGTLYTVMYLPQSLELWLGAGGESESIHISFADWLAGGELPKSVSGWLPLDKKC